MSRKTSVKIGGDSITALNNNDLRDEARLSSYLMAYADSSTTTLKVLINEGSAYFGGTIVEFAGGYSPEIVDTIASSRIDVLSFKSDNSITRTAGVEADSPTTPKVPSGEIPICAIYMRKSATSIKDTDDSTNGYIYKDLRNGIVNIKTDIVPSDNLRHSNDATVRTTSAVLVMVKEIVVPTFIGIFGIGATGIINKMRIKFYAVGQAGRSYNTRIYKNGVALGTLQTIVGDTGQTFSEDLGTFVAGDLIQIYSKGQDGQWLDTSNFRLYYDQVILPDQVFTNNA